MNGLGIFLVFSGAVMMVTRRLVDESGTVVIEGPPAVVIGAILTTIGLTVFFLL